MSYVTLAQLAEIPGALELAQVASDKHQKPVATELMDATLRGGDRSAFTSVEIARADAAADRIQQAITQADAVIDGYLARRYTLPLTAPHALLATWSRNITRYQLHSDRISDERNDPIVRDYRDAMKLLQQVAESKFHLGVNDPTVAATSPGDFLFYPGNKVFGREGRP